MIKIILCCSAAMSTSLLVNKMSIEAQNQGIEAQIWAIPVNEVDQDIDADLILLAPQVHYITKQLQKRVAPIPVYEIALKDYGLMNGKHVFDTAMQLIQNKSI